MQFSALHRAPGDARHLEANLAPGEIITEFIVAVGAWTRRIGTAGMAAAIANAVHHATGRRLRGLPLRIEHLMANG
jgi:hypothetical protein